MHFQGVNSFVYLSNMSTLTFVDVFCIHNLSHYSALLPSPNVQTTVFPSTRSELKEYDYNLLLELDKKDVRKLKTLQPFSLKSANLQESKRGLRIPIM